MVADHGPKDVYPSAGEGEYGLAMALALGSLAVIERPRGGACLDADQRRGVGDALELPVVALRPVQVSRTSSRVARCWREPGVSRQVVRINEPVKAAAGRG